MLSIVIAGAALFGSLQDVSIERMGGKSELSLGGIPFHSTTQPVSGLRSIRLAGSTAVVALWNEGGTPYHGISLDGTRIQRVAESGLAIELQYASFDPLKGVPAVPSRLAANAQNELFIVQFVSMPLEQFRKEIAALGGTVYSYIKNNAYVVRMSAFAKRQVEGMSYVRWVGPYEPAYRLDLSLIASMDSLPTQRYNIRVFESGSIQKDPLANRIRSIGGTVVDAGPGGRSVEADLSARQLLEAAGWNEVMWIDKWGKQEIDMNIARIFSGTNDLQTVAGYGGQGVIGLVRDTGVRGTHNDFDSRPLIILQNSGDTSHGTNTTGIIFGDGAVNGMGKGVLPLGQGVFRAGLSTGATRYNQTQNAINNNHIVFESNSTGSPQTTTYTTVSAEMDDLIFDLDILICQSQSNLGNTQSRPQAWAKNIVAVGGVDHLNTAPRADDNLSGASTGPASDGRIKPDLSHFYDSIFCPSNVSDMSYTSNFGGTSSATPITCGHFGLLFQMWADGVFNNTVEEDTVFDARCHAMTAKALMINSATQYPLNQGGLTRVRQGWGTAAIKDLFDRAVDMFVVDETDVVTPLGTNTYRLYVDAGTPALRATMCYKDLAGNPANQSQHRVNDLTLRVTAPGGGTLYFGNNGLSAGIWSTSGGVANVKDTVENVFVQNPTAGVWTVEILGSEILQDSHVGTPELDADYALVVSGVAHVIPYTSFTLERGIVISGATSDTVTSNDDRYVVRPGPVFTTQEAPIRLIAETTLPTTTPDALQLTVEAGASASNLQARIEMFNPSSGLWEQVDSRVAPSTEEVYTVVVGDPSAYVNGSGLVRVRYSWKPNGPVFIYPYTVGMDHLKLAMIP